jgi:hypothetical protein
LRIKIPTVADDTARGVLYPSPTGGEKVMNTANGGKEEVYNAVTAQWEAAGTSTAVGNATTAAAGIVQVATHAKAVAGDDTGSTGATNSVPPSELAATQQSGTFIYAGASDVSDTYTANLTPAITAYTTGMLVRIKFTTANTGACTINLNGLGAKSIKTESGADPQDADIAAGSTRDLKYDGTNFVLAYAPVTDTKEIHDSIKDSVDASVSKSTGTNYQAATAGFVVCSSTGASFNNSTTDSVLGYVGASNPASTLIARNMIYQSNPQTYGCSVSFPVAKDQWYRCDVSSTAGFTTWTMVFIPLQ